MDTNDDVGLSPEAAFEKVQAVLIATARRFATKREHDLDLLVADAYHAFLGAYQSYRTDRETNFKTWVRITVGKSLAGRKRKTRGEEARSKTEPLPADLPARRTFDVRWLLEEVSEDARLAARLALETPADILITARRKAGGEGRWDNVKYAVVEYLKDIGWGVARIGEAFEEIKEALS